MIGILACALLLIGASIVVGRALMVLIGWREPSWLAGAVGFALLVVIAPFLDRLPGHGKTAFVLIALLTLAAAVITKRATPRRSSFGSGADAGSPASGPVLASPSSAAGSECPAVGTTGARPSAPHMTALAVIVITLAVASLPFLFNERTGVLGEGVYTNDHAAQLYWAQWLSDGYGPEPKAVAFGYPVGPQALTASLSAGTTINLETAFNGLLLAIPVLTALAALAALGGLPPIRRTTAACLTGLPYLAASFLAQSSFKETAMAMFVVALAVALHTGLEGLGVGRRRGSPGRGAGDPTEGHSDPDGKLGDADTGPSGEYRGLGPSTGPRALGPLAVVVVVLGLAAVFTFSIPGAAWFVLAIGGLLAVSYVAGDFRVDFGAVRGWVGSHRKLSAAAGLLVLALLAIAVGPGLSFISKIDDVQQSSGRLSSPVFPGEALGIWPEGDFRIVRGDVSGAVPAVAFAFICAALAAFALFRRREWALLSVLGSAVVVYGLARPFAEIHVEAKALTVLAPILTLVVVRWLLAPDESATPGPATSNSSRLRLAAGAVFVVAATVSTLLALRAAPVSFDQRADALERIGEKIEGKSVIFLGLDRFAAYRLRGTLIESPGGYVPPDVEARPQKAWQQGTAIDFDTVKSRKLDHFDYAITTDAAYQSHAPDNFSMIESDDGYVLWERNGPTTENRVLNEGGDPGATLDCSTPLGKHASDNGSGAYVLATPITKDQPDWSQRSPFDAPASAETDLALTAGTWELSLQYHSQVPLTVSISNASSENQHAELPANLDGFYLSGAGRGPFWAAGTINVDASDGPTTVSVAAAAPSGLQDALGVERKTWLGTIAATKRIAPTEPGVGQVDSANGLSKLCGSYVDHYTLR
jgi:hypothetical protein